MDPSACLRRIDIAETRDEHDDACSDLRRWLVQGGFAPKWDSHPKGAKRYRRWCLRSGISIPTSLMEATL